MRHPSTYLPILLWIGCCAESDAFRFGSVPQRGHPSTAPTFGVVSYHPEKTQRTSRSIRLLAVHQQQQRRRRKTSSNRKPSRVSDPDGPTPEYKQVPIEKVSPDDIDELRDIRDAAELPRPIPHQPWRRGDTAGCEDPIAAEWRREAEDVIRKAAILVDARVLDVTWYLTHVVITLDDENLPAADMLKSSGPEIDIIEKSDPVYRDPSDPDPEDIWGDTPDGEVLYRHQTDEEADAARVRKNMTYATKDADDPADEPHNPDAADGDDIPLYMNEETRPDVAPKVAEDELERYELSEKPMDLGTLTIDTSVLSTVAEAILGALDDVEDELRILSRHEVILTSPGPSDALETQRQFDAYRGTEVVVETRDPFDSNRTLKGRLVDRNSMDLIISKKGRMVTIPLNFVRCVRIPPEKKEAKAGEDGEEEEDKAATAAAADAP